MRWSAEDLDVQEAATTWNMSPVLIAAAWTWNATVTHHLTQYEATRRSLMQFRPEGTPPLYEQDGKGYDAIVFAHYFIGTSDWLVTEYSPEEDIAFGWACLSGDRQSAELGYVSLTELEAIQIPVSLETDDDRIVDVFFQKVERDAHWPEGLTITQAIARLDQRDGRTPE